MKTVSISPQRGVSLIEALVALLVLALGIMVLAGIQTRTLVESRTTHARAIAHQMADDLLDRMQANVGLRINPPASNPYIVNWWGGAAPKPFPAPNPDCRMTTCNAAQLAAFDLNQWKKTLDSLLPSGDARVFQSPTDPTQFGVLIGWAATQAKNEGSASNTQQALYDAAISVRDGLGNAGTGVANIPCPTAPVRRICHLVYIRP